MSLDYGWLIHLVLAPHFTTPPMAVTELDELGSRFPENARHNKKANGLFIDGHVEGCQRRRLEGLGIAGLFDKDAIPAYY